MSGERPRTKDEGRTEAASIDRLSCVAGPSCVTCSDEATPARVLSVDEASWTAIVGIEHTTMEVDISLVDTVAAGDWLLVHGGVALERLEKTSDG